MRRAVQSSTNTPCTGYIVRRTVLPSDLVLHRLIVLPTEVLSDENTNTPVSLPDHSVQTYRLKARETSTVVLQEPIRPLYCWRTRLRLPDVSYTDHSPVITIANHVPTLRVDSEHSLHEGVTVSWLSSEVGVDLNHSRSREQFRRSILRERRFDSRPCFPAWSR